MRCGAAEEIRHERVAADGVTLHVARTGEGPPVILLHGFPEHWRSWRRQLGPLAAAGFSAWAPDLRGYNLSDRPAAREAYHLRHLVADVAALVRATGHDRAAIVGHDWGGVVAWTFAGTHPELVNRLVILNAPHLDLYLREVRRPAQMARSWYVLLFRVPWLAERLLAAGDYRALRRMFAGASARPAFSAEDIEAYVQAMAQPGALTAALAYYRANATPSALTLARRARVRAPTLVVWGERDPALGLGLLDGIARVAPDVTVLRLRAAGHWVQNEAPDEVNAALLQFLAR